MSQAKCVDQKEKKIPLRLMKVWRTFTSFDGLFEFIGRNKFEIVLVFEDGSKLKSEYNYLRFPVDRINVSLYHDSSYLRSNGLSCVEYDYKYVSEKLNKLEKIPHFTYKDLSPSGIFSEKINNLEILAVQLCKGAIFIEKGKLVFTPHNLESSKLVKHFLVKNSSQNRFASEIDSEKTYQTLIKESFCFPLGRYTCMSESVSGYFKYLLKYDEYDPLAKMYYYWLEDYFTTYLIHYVMSYLVALGKSVFPLNFERIDREQHGQLRKLITEVFLKKIRTLLPQLPVKMTFYESS